MEKWCISWKWNFKRGEILCWGFKNNLAHGFGRQEKRWNCVECEVKDDLCNGKVKLLTLTAQVMKASLKIFHIMEQAN